MLVYFTLRGAQPMPSMGQDDEPLAALRGRLRNPRCDAAFAIGFCILFAFIGTFTFVNFVLVREPLMLNRMQLGLVYFVFAPSIVTTLLAGPVVMRHRRSPCDPGRVGCRRRRPAAAVDARPPAGAWWHGAGRGRHVFRTGRRHWLRRPGGPANRGIASGVYLACYFLGGLVGTAILGRLFDSLGWSACVIGIACSLVAAALLATKLKLGANA